MSVDVRAPSEEQVAAIDAPGVVFVSAGAGTGKTTVLVERFVKAVCDRGLGVDSLLVITYTERAAGELRSRIRARLEELGRDDLARELDGAWISTIHGFCHRLLKSHPFAAGIDPRFRVLDESQARVLQSEAFAAALEDFLDEGDEERSSLLATYSARALRRMLTGVYATLRAAGRPLILELGERPGLGERIEELKDAARCLAEETEAGETAKATAARAIELLEERTLPERLFDLSELRARGERAATYEEARRGVEQAALDELAARDRDLLAGAARSLRACLSRRPRSGNRRSTSKIFSSSPETSCERTPTSVSGRAGASARSWSTSSRTRTASSASSSTYSPRARTTRRSSSSATSSSRSTDSGTPMCMSSASVASTRRACSH